MGKGVVFVFGERTEEVFFWGGGRGLWGGDEVVSG